MITAYEPERPEFLQRCSQLWLSAGPLTTPFGWVHTWATGNPYRLNALETVGGISHLAVATLALVLYACSTCHALFLGVSSLVSSTSRTRVSTISRGRQILRVPSLTSGSSLFLLAAACTTPDRAASPQKAKPYGAEVVNRQDCDTEICCTSTPKCPVGAMCTMQCLLHTCSSAYCKRHPVIREDTGPASDNMSRREKQRQGCTTRQQAVV